MRSADAKHPWTSWGRRPLWLAGVVLLSSATAFGQMAPFAGNGGQMPDPKQISGQPLPVTDLSPGTVVVRVVRGELTNVLSGQAVTLTAGGQAKTLTTDQSGHAEFDGLPVGAKAQATVTVAGEKIDSQAFDVPATGGIRLMLVATDPEAEKRAAQDAALARQPPIEGVVVLGDQSRFVVEVADDALNVYNILPILNTAKRPVKTPPLVFDLPADAKGVGLLQGSTQQATASGDRVVVQGPFAPGTTMLQFAYSIPLGRPAITIDQAMPVPVAQFAIVAQKTGEMRLSSPQILNQREMPAEGQMFIAGQGRSLKAGETLTLTFSGLPHRPLWPRATALVAAAVILLGGAWAAMRRPRAVAGDARRRLQEEQSRLYGALAALEHERRDGRVEQGVYDVQRAALMNALEAVYARLDAEAAA